ncbi:MAG: hypothetical protein IKS45_10955 [Thermoguttaceae bacterium]|nr:hypothetical protein [Thermoguttaceae bacterium]
MPQIPFQELSGSPEETYTTDDFAAVRKFLVPWTARNDFADWLRGATNVFGPHEAIAYPNRPDVEPYKINIQPFDAATLEKTTMTDSPSEALNCYSSFALVTVYYKLLTSQDLEDGPTAESGTRLTYRINFQLQEVEINGAGLYWHGSTTSLGSNAEIVKTVPLTEHILTWKQVLFPPWTAMRELQGKVNSVEFLDCPPGTLLYEGVGVNKLFRSDLQDGASEFCWQLEYRFLQRIIYQGASRYGWNAVYRKETGKWENVLLGKSAGYVLNSGTPFYESGDFNALFVSEIS